jgi:hypothetical protein
VAALGIGAAVGALATGFAEPLPPPPDEELDAFYRPD